MFTNIHFLSLIVLLFQSILFTSLQHIRVYSGYWHQGNHADVQITQCSNIPLNLSGKVIAVNTINRCARLYDNINCVGKYIEILPRSPAHGRLSIWNFSNKALSAGPCPSPCPVQINLDSVEVFLFRQKYFKGSYLDINVTSCTRIPREYQNNGTMSVQTKGNCIQLYSTEECVEKPGVDTIELRPGTPQHNDISAWKFPFMKAASRCDYKCLNISFLIPNKGVVFLFKSTYLKGISYNFTTINRECVNFPNDWEGSAQSIGLGIDTCVILFDLRGCIGRQHRINKSVLSLYSVSFDSQVRSVKSCISTSTTTLATEALTTNDPTTDPIILTTNDPAILTTNDPTTDPNFLTTNDPTTDPTMLTTITTKVAIISGHNQAHSSSSEFSPFLITVLVVVPLVAVILTTIVVFCVFKHCSPYKKEGVKLSEKEIREFLSGMGIDLRTNGGGSNTQKNDYSTEFLAQNNAYNMEYELAKSRIEIDPGAILGSGEFGIVYKGKLAILHERETGPSTSTREKTTVAIKTVNQTSGLNGIRSLLKEVKIMLYMGHHDNIAKLIGCCTENIREGDIMVVMEYCSEGSLESYLKKNRMSFFNLVDKGKLNQEGRTTSDITETDDTRFDTHLLVQWSLEIARGMEFLSNAKVVHSDLAARNILLNDQLVAKISDFGLSRQLYAYSQYMKKHQEPLPFRWMAIESLKCLEFSTKSDVWSYGVLIWEIFSLGEKPYPGLGWNEAFISNLESGLRLAKPKNSTNELYNLMLRCWDENPAGRPAFTGIVEEIQEMKAGFSSDAYTTL